MRVPDTTVWTALGMVGAAVTGGLLVLDALTRWTTAPRRPSAAHAPDTAADVRTRTQAADANDRLGHALLPVQRRRRRRAPTEPAAVARWLDDLAQTTRSGASLVAGVYGVEPSDGLAPQVDPLRARVGKGDSLLDALTTWNDEIAIGDESLRTAASALIAVTVAGGDLAAPLERAAAVLRSRTAAAQERASWAAQAQLSARVLALAPPAVLGVFVLVDDGALRVLRSPAGVVLMSAGLALDAIGFAWMRRIVRRAAQ